MCISRYRLTVVEQRSNKKLTRDTSNNVHTTHMEQPNICKKKMMYFQSVHVNIYEVTVSE